VAQPPSKPVVVLVYVNGNPIYVPEVVTDVWSFRGALGLRRTEAVAREGALHEQVTGIRGHLFAQGDRFVVLDDALDDGEVKEAQPEDPDKKMPWEDEGDAWKKA
jgi:hypothetical protein